MCVRDEYREGRRVGYCQIILEHIQVGQYESAAVDVGCRVE